jgi:hypothetical protein
MNVVATRVRAACVFLALLLGFSLVVGARPAYACSCAGMWDTDEEFQRSDAVFAGEVVEVGELSVERAGPTDPRTPLLAPVTFDVKGAWKGVAGDSVVVHGQGPAPSCGLDFERGETYLVFAGRAGEGENGPLQTDMCSSTRQSSVETARNMFGPPTGILPETGGPAPLAVGGALLAMAGLSACAVRAVGALNKQTRL